MFIKVISRKFSETKSKWATSKRTFALLWYILEVELLLKIIFSKKINNNDYNTMLADRQDIALYILCSDNFMQLYLFTLICVYIIGKKTKK